MPIQDRWLDDGRKTSRHGVGLRYRAYFRGVDGKQRSKSFARKLDAKRWLEDQASARNRGDWIAPERARATLADVWDVWLPTKALKPSTLDSYRRLWSKHIEPTFGHQELRHITFGAVSAWVSELRKTGKAGPGNTRVPLSISRTRQAHTVLSMLLEHAVREQRITRNPAASVELPRLSRNGRQNFLTVAQLDELAQACARSGSHGTDEPIFRTMILFLGLTGLRWGEMVALTVADVDPLRRRIFVRRTATEVNGHVVTGPPKNGQDREVPLPSVLHEDLVLLAGGKTPDDLLFVAPVGHMQKHADFRRRAFPRATAEIGQPELVPHDLRHTAASLAIASGASIKLVQRMLGHSSAAMTLDRYGHLYDDELDALTRRLDEHFAAGRVRASIDEAEAVASGT